MAEELYVNGVNIKTLATNVETLGAMLRGPALRGSNPVSANRSGSIWTGLKPHEAPVYTWPMWVVGALEDGTLPEGVAERLQFYKNVDKITALFQGGRQGLPTLGSDPRAGLNRVEHVLPNNLGTRVADLELVSAFDFSTQGVNPIGKIVLELENPAAYWRSDSLFDATVQNNAAGGPILANASAGATAPLDDASYIITGPVTNPKIIDQNNQDAYFQYLGTIGNGQTLQIDARPYNLTGTGGFVPQFSQVSYVNTLGRLMRLIPGRDGGYEARFVSASTNTGATLRVVGFKKYMVG